jgi:protein-S-isoprenylcysteine O-methyltransferase Ste14
MVRLKALLIGSIMPLLVAAIIFLAAGRWDLPFVWGVIAALTGFLVATVATADEGMIRERVSPGGDDQDRLSRVIGGVLLFGSWIVTGLDVGRFHWSLVPRSLQVVGLVGYVVSLALLFWAMRSNPFYSSVVRVQTDRGQRPVTAGPYRFVRHPGYAASILAMLTGSLALGSWLGMLLMLGFIAVFIRRTLLEDRLLQRDLPGYADYARRVRYRLVPGVF